jgi:hypothetical protein
MPRPEELKEWASSLEAKRFKEVLQEQVDEAIAGLVAGQFDLATSQETAVLHLTVLERIRAVKKVLSTLEDMAEWEPESKTEGESNVY